MLPPAYAFASTNGVDAEPTWVPLVIGGLSLIAAAVLLIDAVLLKRVAFGGAIAEHISYMILAAVCLAASVLVDWVVKTALPDISAPQAGYASDGLVLLAMVLLATYFWRVRTTLTGYLKEAAAYASGADLFGDVTDPEPSEPDPTSANPDAVSHNRRRTDDGA